MRPAILKEVEGASASETPLALLQRFGSLAERALICLAGGDAERVVELLSEREQLMPLIEPLIRATARSRSGGGELQRAGAEREILEREIHRIMDTDRRLQGRLEEQRRELSREMRQLENQIMVHAAYGRDGIRASRINRFG